MKNNTGNMTRAEAIAQLEDAHSDFAKRYGWLGGDPLDAVVESVAVLRRPPRPGPAIGEGRGAVSGSSCQSEPGVTPE